MSTACSYSSLLPYPENTFHRVTWYILPAPHPRNCQSGWQHHRPPPSPQAQSGDGSPWVMLPPPRWVAFQENECSHSLCLKLSIHQNNNQSRILPLQDDRSHLQMLLCQCHLVVASGPNPASCHPLASFHEHTQIISTWKAKESNKLSCYLLAYHHLCLEQVSWGMSDEVFKCISELFLGGLFSKMRLHCSVWWRPCGIHSSWRLVSNTIQSNMEPEYQHEIHT